MVSRSPIVQGRLRTFFQQVGIQVGAAQQADAVREACAMGRHLLGRRHHLRPLLLQHDPGIEAARSEEHTSELQSLMRISYAVFCLKKKKYKIKQLRKQI